MEPCSARYTRSPRAADWLSTRRPRIVCLLTPLQGSSLSTFLPATGLPVTQPAFPSGSGSGGCTPSQGKARQVPGEKVGGPRHGRGSEQRQVVLSTDTTRVLLVDTHTGTGKGAPDCGCKLQAPTAEGVVTVVSALRTLGGWGAGRCGGRAGATPGFSTGASRQQWATGAGGARAVGALPGAGPGARGRGRSWESLQGPRGPARGAQT